jgi:hypothetical protein
MQFPYWTEKKHITMQKNDKTMKKGLTDSYPLVIMYINFKIFSR